VAVWGLRMNRECTCIPLCAFMECCKETFTFTS
jgi:hypothetical protein